MKKITFENAQKQPLVGCLYAGQCQTAVILVHGFLSNKRSSGRFDKIARRFNAVGYPVLSFDFGGCGESVDMPISLQSLISDLEAAKAVLRSQGYQKLVLYGHSLGGLVSLHCLDEDVETVILTGPVTGPVPFATISQLQPEQTECLAQKGYYYERLASDDWRDQMCVSAAMINDFETVDQQQLWQAVTIPVLIIHGTEAEEAVLKQNSERLTLPSGSKLVVFEGADHGFFEQFAAIETLVSQWLLEHTN